MRPASRLNAIPEVPIHTIQVLSRDYSGPGEPLDFSQGVLGAQPDAAVLDAVASAARAGAGKAYVRHGDLTRLTELFIDDLARTHSGRVRPDQVSITNGANEAFCGALATIAGAGDHVVMTTPYYFNQHIWVAAQGLDVSYWDLPDATVDLAALARLITPRTKAVIVVTPGNPTGAQLAPDDIAALARLCRDSGCWLLLDETYRAFSSRPGPVHHLFEDDDWADNVLFTYSFSKEFGIPGYRIGVLVADAAVHPQFDKWREAVSIMPSTLGVVAAEASLEHGLSWRAEQTAATLGRGRALRACLEETGRFGWTSGGALYGWVRHDRPGVPDLEVAAELARDHGVMTLPGSAFAPGETGHLRWSVGTATDSEIALLRERLRGYAAAR